MKLLFCDRCYDVFKLTSMEERSCQCGYVTGEYVDDRYAVTNGKGFSIAIGNGSLIIAIRRMMELKGVTDESNRDDYIEKCKIDYAWVRPNEGNGNPHTKVE